MNSTRIIPSITTLLTGSSLAIAVSYAARPVLTRLFDPESFGLLGFFVAVAAVVGSASTARYEDAIVLSDDDDEARDVALVGLCALALITVTSFVIPFLAPFIAGASGNAAIEPYLIWIPPVVAFGGIVRLSENWFTRKRRFRPLAGTRVIQNLATAAAQLGAGFQRMGSSGLIAGFVVGSGAAALFAGTIAGASIRRMSSDDPWRARLRRRAIRYKRFPQFSAPSALLNTLSAQLPALFLFFFFDSSVVGRYVQGYALIAIPVGLVSGSVAPVFFERASRVVSDRAALALLTASVFRRLLILGAFPLAAVLVAGPDLVEFALGDGWRDAGIYARLLSVWLLLVLISSPLSKLFDVFERQRDNLLFNVGLFMARVIALTVGGLMGDPIIAVGLFGVTGALIWLFHTGWMLSMGGVSLRTGLQTLGHVAIMLAVPISAPLTALAMGASQIVLVASVVVGGLIYAVIAVRSGVLSENGESV